MNVSQSVHGRSTTAAIVKSGVTHHGSGIRPIGSDGSAGFSMGRLYPRHDERRAGGRDTLRP